MKCREIPITTPFIKLDSFLKFTGASQTGGHGKLLIENDQVQVNGEICKMRGKKLYSGDEVLCMGVCYRVINEVVEN